MRFRRGLYCIVLCSLSLSGVAAAQSAATEAEQNMAAGRYAMAGQAYRHAFEQTSEPKYLKLSGQAYMAVGPAGRDEAIRSLRQYIQSARTLEEAQDGEALLRQAEAMPQQAAAPAPVPAPAPYTPPPAAAPAPYTPPPAAAPAPAPYPAPASAPAPYPGQPAPAPAAGPAPVPPPAAGPAPVATEAPAAASTGALVPPATEPPESEASEKSFGKQGTFAISGERLTLLAPWKARIVSKDATSGEETQVTYSGTDIALLGMGAGTFNTPSDKAVILRMSSVPRIAFDYFLADKISVGGFLGYFSRSGSTETKTKTASESADGPSSNIAFIGARGSYFLPFGASRFGAWFRAGLSYVSSSSTLTVKASGLSADVTTSLSEVMANVDAMVLLPITSGFAIAGGPFVDGSLTGTLKEEAAGVSISNDAGELAYGLTFGVTGYL